ncbi:hypothetical protein [Streptomyces sp. NPDC098781]|uniref:hypothetical protein n=1 Tax=Streptomyces sp. NPDC098781 TaxID=3366097 RepID=UPI0038260F9E
MRRIGILATVASAFALMASATPAHAGDLMTFYNMHTAKCLNGAPSLSKPVMSGCGANAHWDVTSDSRGTKFMVGAGIKCLDTNGTDVYLSPCSDADPGQWWNAYMDPSSVRGYIRWGDKYLTAWNDGSLSMARSSQVDQPSKYHWRW